MNYQRIPIDEWDTNMTRLATSGVSGTTSIENAGKITSNIARASSYVYADEILPFDITISFANEYGQRAVVVIYSVEILNEGSGFSTDIVGSEKACTFVARSVEYMRPVSADGTPLDISNGNTTSVSAISSTASTSSTATS